MANNRVKKQIMSEEFKKYVDELNEKILIAAEALKEVNRVKKLAGLSSIINSSNFSYEFDMESGKDDPSCDPYDKLYEMFDMIKKHPLEDEINKAGWRTSSSYC